MVEQKEAVIEVAGRRHWRKDDARVLIGAWQQSGQTMTAFARDHDIHPERLARWHRLLRAEPQESVQFHPVRVRTSACCGDTCDNRIEVVLSAGHSVRVPHGFDAGELRRVLAVLGADA
jgi:hypothetical protein